ncbi:MAG TPA: class I SAM-dependent methyltransferase [Gallionella sp.]|nr:class I SAM-dependent methyltransferase [Gallionella sp.]
MKFCLACQQPFADTLWKCPACGDAPAERGGFLAFAPALAAQNDGFNPELFERYAAVEAGHFWFVGRNNILRDRMLRHFSGAKNILEIGCGTGFVLSNTRQAFPDAQLSGSDIFTEGLGYAKQRVPSAFLFQMDACHIPYRNEFDLIGAFDVLEHIDDDRAALGQIYQACQPGGGIVLTVPQHRWLWSSTDDYAHHKRRYTRAEFVEKVTGAGFKVEYVGSFVSLLLPAMLASRLLQKSAQADDQMDAGFKIGKLTNAVLGAVMKVERWLIARGISFPLGGSLLVVARKDA